MHVLDVQGADVEEIGPNVTIVDVDEEPLKTTKLIFLDSKPGEYLVLMEEEITVMVMKITDPEGVVQVNFAPTEREINLVALRAKDITDRPDVQRVIH